MSKFTIKKRIALLLLFAFFCITSCLSCISKEEGDAGEESPPPVKEAAVEEPAIVQQERENQDVLPKVEPTKENAIEEPQIDEPPVEEPVKVETPEPVVAEPQPVAIETQPEVAATEEAPIIEEIAKEESEPPAEESVDEEDEIVAIIDDVVITRKDYMEAKSQVEVVIEELNQITKKKQYSRWLGYLDDEYKDTLSNRAYLSQITGTLPKVLRDRRVKLNNIRDYFEYVFVPSRQDIRVDDIEYITPTRVYVMMDMSGGRRAAVYILQKEDDGAWKLANKH